MKTRVRLFYFASIVTLLSSSFALFKIPSLEVRGGSSGYTASKLPSEIDLNPVEDTEVRSYYASLAGRNLSGDDLLKELKPILMNGQQYYSYDSGDAIWKMYEITDRDWELSPAEEITNGTYDKTSNKISGYVYGTNSNKLDNPYLHVLYRIQGVEEAKLRAWDKHGNNDGIDREHIWPKSRGFGMNDGVEMALPGARGDIHHLLPGDSYVNSTTHSNYSYGFVDLSKIKNDAGSKYLIDGKKVVDGNYRGTSLTFGTSLGSNEVFEPQDADKGDIARACFYMVARYNNIAGDDENIDAGNPNLFLEDTVDKTTIYSTPTKAVSIGILRDLLAWHKLDPVDEYERHRNDIIYRNYGKNRNPFIDFPSWVDAIWGDVELDEDNRTITKRNASPIGVANPTSDPLYEIDNYNIVSLTVTINENRYFIGENFAFNGTIIGVDDNGNSHDITKKCTFSNTSLSNAGSQQIHVFYKDQAESDFLVNVLEPAKIEIENPKTDFYVDDAFAFDGKAMVASNDNFRKDLTSQCMFSGFDSSKAGTNTITVTYSPTGLQATYQIKIVEKPLTIFGMSVPLFIGVAVIALIILVILIVIFIKTGKKPIVTSAKKPKGGRKSTKGRKRK